MGAYLKYSKHIYTIRLISDLYKITIIYSKSTAVVNISLLIPIIDTNHVQYNVSIHIISGLENVLNKRFWFKVYNIISKRLKRMK